MRRWLDWFFRDRRTDRIVIAQRPNIALSAWILALIVRIFVHGKVATWVGVVGSLALLVWSIQEIVAGVNPWRRTLGGVVLLALVIRTATSL